MAFAGTAAVFLSRWTVRGYSGSARDMDMATQAARPPKSPEDLLDRMACAAERLSLSTTSPELEDYARTMRDCVEALKTMPMSVRISASPMSGIKHSD